MSKEKRAMGMPEIEFEGPMGMFWSLEEVPFEAMTLGVAEIFQELVKRGYNEQVIIEAIKAHGELKRSKYGELLKVD